MFVYANILSILTGLKQRKDDTGATAVEYALLVSFIAIAIIAGITLLGGNLGSMFSSVASKV